MCKTFHLALLNFLRFIQVNLSSLSRSFCMASLPPKHSHTCLPSLLQTPLTVLVGAMVTTGGVLGTLCPPGGTMMGPMGPRLGVLAGELWLVAGEDTGDDSLLSEDPGIKPKVEVS